MIINSRDDLEKQLDLLRAHVYKQGMGYYEGGEKVMTKHFVKANAIADGILDALFPFKPGHKVEQLKDLKNRLYHNMTHEDATTLHRLIAKEIAELEATESG